MGAGIHRKYRDEETDTPKSHSLCEWTKFFYNRWSLFSAGGLRYQLPILHLKKPSLKNSGLYADASALSTVKVTGYAISVRDRSHIY